MPSLEHLCANLRTEKRLSGRTKEVGGVEGCMSQIIERSFGEYIDSLIHMN